MKSEGNDGGTSYGSESKNARSIDRARERSEARPSALRPLLIFSLSRLPLFPIEA